MKRHQPCIHTLVSILFVTACSSSNEQPASSDESSETAATNATENPTDPSASESGSGANDESSPKDSDSNSDANSDNEASPSDAMPEEEHIRFDTPDGSEEMGADCAHRSAGTYCADDFTSYTCDDEGKEIDRQNCRPQVCAPEVGCILCRKGQIACKGNQVLRCDTSVPGHRWRLVEECNPLLGQSCDFELGTCANAKEVGSPNATGEYWLFATFTPEDHENIALAADVDSFETRVMIEGELHYDNKVYTSHNQTNAGALIDIYEVLLLDSDGDGKLEPNQHPKNSENPGEVEERQLVFIETIEINSDYYLDRREGEIFAAEDRIFYSGQSNEGAAIVEYVFATQKTNVITTPLNRRAFPNIGYDEVNEIWFAGTRDRKVWHYDHESSSWGIGFAYPNLAGSHQDGMEVVVDPNSQVPYVYVSDMTSDFLAQYHLGVDGWKQGRVFEYTGPPGSAVEGMGFGAFAHFWMASGMGELYEVGGGDLQEFTEPVQ